MTTTRRFNLTPVTRPGDRGGACYADGGALTQDGPLGVFECDCGAEVVWATSSKTGRKYLAAVYRGMVDQRYYVKANVHSWEAHDQRLARNIEDDRQFRARSIIAQHANDPAGMLAALETLG